MRRGKRVSRVGTRQKMSDERKRKVKRRQKGERRQHKKGRGQGRRQKWDEMHKYLYNVEAAKKRAKEIGKGNRERLQ